MRSLVQILITLVMLTGSSYSAAQCGGPVPKLCDADEDFDVDSDDISAISLAKGTPSSGPGDIRDIDGDGKITVLDARQCVSYCDEPQCAVSDDPNNIPPVAVAGPDQTVYPGDEVVLSGSGSSDTDGDPLTFQWTLTSRPSGSTAILSDADTVTPSFTVDVPGDYLIELIVNDGVANSLPDTVTVTTYNSAPVAEAGTDQSLFVGDTATLDGSASSDIDGDLLQYYWSLISRPDGSTAELSDPAAVQPTFTVDFAGTYEAQLIVNDGILDSPPDTVLVTTLNSPPVADAGPDQNVLVTETVQLDASGSSDVDGDQLTFKWSFTLRPEGSAAALSDEAAVRPEFTSDVPGTYIAQLIVNDGQIDSAPDTLTITTQNSAPVARAGDDQTVFVGEEVVLDGTASSDIDGDPLQYFWSLSARPETSNSTILNPDSAIASFVPDVFGSYVAQLIVNDGQTDSAPDTVAIMTENSRPVANAGSDQSVFVNDVVQLDGTGSNDIDGDSLTFLWSFTSRPEGSSAELSNAQAVNPTFTVDLPGDYVLQLIVNDGTLDSVPDTLTVTTDNSRPEACIEPMEPVYVGDAVSLVSCSTDSNGDQLDYQWSLLNAPAGSGASIADAAAEMASLTPDLAGSYVIQLIVSDGILESEPVTTVVTAEEVSDEDIDGDGLTDAAEAALGTNPNNPDTDGDGLTDGAEVNIHNTSPLLGDTDEDGYGDSDEIANQTDPRDKTSTPSYPRDPVYVAPPVDKTVATTVFGSTEFLYTGANPIQIGVAPDTIEPARAAVVRGRVLNANGQSLSGVAIAIKGHPEFGSTRSRGDGMFDMAVNGGGLLTIEYRRDGYLPAQRQVQAPWQDFVIAEDIVLLEPDSRVTTVNLASLTEIQVARGNAINDARGMRTATVMFTPGTQATMTLPDGSTTPLTTLNVRATEFTVGDKGISRMPGPLPPTSAYTYAVDLTVDEALAAGATKVSFSQPVPFYVDNFLGFPVGIQVPTAYYDRVKSAWVPIPDGKVIRIIDISGGLAELDTTGNGQADNGIALGISSEERATLAQTYSAGQSLWRVTVSHFTPYDPNWPTVPPTDAKPPTNPPPAPSAPEAPNDSSEPNSCPGSSVVDCQQQRLRETLGIVGTPLVLSYSSDGNMPQQLRTIKIPLSGSSLPSSLKLIKLTVDVAGTTYSQEFPALPNQATFYAWDGRNAFGQEAYGGATATIRIDYVYDGFYALSRPVIRSFGTVSGLPMPGNIQGPDVVLSQTHSIDLVNLPRPASAFGWRFTDHHVYDPNTGSIYLGNGNTQITLPYRQLDENIAALTGFKTGLAIGPDGSVIWAQRGSPFSTIYKQTPNEPSSVLFSGVAPGLTGVAIGADGSVYFADQSQSVIRRVTDGTVVIVAGSGTSGFSGDGGPATAARISAPVGVAIGADGSIYFADTSNHRIRRVSPDGTINTVAGSGTAGYSGDGGPAIAARISRPTGLAVGGDGSVVFADAGNNRIRRVTPDGLINTVAGTGIGGFSGDGGPATMARLSSSVATGLSNMYGVAIASDGSIIFADTGNGRVRSISADGIINTVIGSGSTFLTESPFGLAPTQAAIGLPAGVAIAPNGRIYFTSLVLQFGGSLIGYALDGSQISTFNSNFITVPSEDGSKLYIFDSVGRHISTRNSLTDGVLYEFEYDQLGLLSSITDGDGNSTVIKRDSEGNPYSIVAPDGQLTTLSTDTNGFLRTFVDPSGEAVQMSYTDTGLLTSFMNARGQTSQYTYDSLGRLLNATSSDLYKQALSRTLGEQGYAVQRSTALGRKTNYAVDFLPTGVERRTSTLPDGTATVVAVDAGGSTTVNLPDGATVKRNDGPDPRFGMLSPLPASVTTTNGSLVLTEQITRSAAYQNMADPSSPLISLTEIRTKNSRESSRAFTVATKTFVDTTPAGRTLETVIDAQGRTVRTRVPGLADIDNTYDTRGRLTTVEQGDRVTTFAYDSNGYLSSITDPMSRTVQYTNDAVGRVTSQTGPDGEVVSFTYDANGNLTSLTPPDRPPHTFEYTPGDLEAAYVSPDLGDGLNVTTTDYDLDRATDLITLPSGATIDPAYDAAGRLSTLTIGRGQYDYDYYPTTGKLQNVTAPDGGALSFTYTGSLLLSEAWSGSTSGSVEQTYDNDFRVTSQRVNGANAVTFIYDADSLLTNAGNMTLTRDAQNGFLTGTVLGTVTDAYDYSAFGELSSYESTAGGTDLFDVTFQRDALGRITEKAEVIQGASTTYAYTYDAAGQLDQVRQNGTLVSDYEYDANGNRTALATQFETTTGTYDDQDRLLTYGSATYTYTPDGNLHTKVQGGQTTTYTYDELGNLTAVELPNGTTIGYIIDGMNRRVGRSVNGVITHRWLYEGKLRPVAELDQTGNVVSRFVYGTHVNVPEYMVRGGVTYRVITDHLGSPRQIVNAANGQVMERLDYDEFGNLIEDTNPGFQPFGFAGGLYDSLTQLTRFGARDFDPKIGRWISKDPIRFLGGDPNLYVYVGNSPVNSIDPTGTVSPWGDADERQIARDNFENTVELFEWITTGPIEAFLSITFSPDTASAPAPTEKQKREQQEFRERTQDAVQCNPLYQSCPSSTDQEWPPDGAAGSCQPQGSVNLNQG